MSYITVGMILITVIKLTVFIIGFLTIRMGKELLLSGVKGEFKFSGEAAGTKANLQSASPGLLFVLLGVFLIGYSMTIDKNVIIDEKANSEVIKLLEQELAEAPIP